MAFTISTNRVDGLHLSTSTPGLWTGQMGVSCPAGASGTETPLLASFKLSEVPWLLSSAAPPMMAPLPCLNEILGTSIDACCTDAADLQFLQYLEKLLSIEPRIHEPGIHGDHSVASFSHGFADFFQHMANHLFHCVVMFAALLSSPRDVIHDESEPAHPHGLDALHISSAALQPVPSSDLVDGHGYAPDSRINVLINDLGPGKCRPPQEQLGAKNHPHDNYADTGGSSAIFGKQHSCH